MTIKSIVHEVVRSTKNINGGVDIDQIREGVVSLDSGISITQIKRALRDMKHVVLIDSKNSIYRVKGRAT